MKFAGICLLFAVASVAAAAKLRSKAPVVAPNASVVKAATAKKDDSAADMKSLGLPENLVNSLSKLASSTPKPAAVSNSTHRAKLDVGFKDFEKGINEKLSAGIRNTTKDAPWTAELRERFVANATGSMSASLKASLAPVKANIGKTWMALKTDDQKNELVAQFKSSFESVFERSADTFVSHMNLFLTRVKSLSEPNYMNVSLSTDVLLAKSEQSFADAFIGEHCYDSTVGKAKKFCIQSVMSSIAKRLHDSEDLISMSARFDAGAMSLAQKAKQAKK